MEEAELCYMTIHENSNIEKRIFNIQGKSMMIDRDIAELFQVPTKRINEIVKRNSNRFPDYYFFRLSNDQKNQLVANCDRFESLKHSSVNPVAFTDYGVAMIATLVNSEIAALVSIGIIDAFIRMKSKDKNGEVIINHLFHKSNIHEEKINWLMKQFENPDVQQQGIFFNDQIFDAYVFSSELIASAKNSIVLIDNYIDETTLLQLSKRNPEVECFIYTEKITPQLKLDLEKHNAQYPPIQIKLLKNVHDRFLILDKKTLFHLGASLKDLGKRWFAFSKMDDLVEDVLRRLP
jgi:hypothetical protein